MIISFSSHFLTQILARCSIGGGDCGIWESLLIPSESEGLRPVVLISKTLCLICPDLKKDQQLVEIIEFRVKSIDDELMGL
jgi:hypothetical protein